MNPIQAGWLVAQEHRLRRQQGSVGYRIVDSSRSFSRRSRSIHRARTIAVVLIVLSFLTSIGWSLQVHALGQNDAITVALNWLTSHQQSDGSYGSLTEPQTAPAANALWVRFIDSSNVLLSYQWLKNQLQNTTTTWFWVGGASPAEADIPGEMLYSFDQSNNLQMLNQLPQVEGKLSKFQQNSTGGFLGYTTSTGQHVTSSVDTAMALLGLIGAKGISSTSENLAIAYLFSLQNTDGSFNLTSAKASDSLYSLGPEPISITALTVLALQAASFAATNSQVASALNYLSNAARSSFNGHVYAASLSLLVYANFGDLAHASIADSYILSQQNADGGFRDISRSSSGSNPLDTGWAVLSLQLGGRACCALPGGGGGSRIINL